ncbi:hypothetical protein [Aquimarina sp. 2201CG5-10]|uniref:HORMA-1 domain-containing protein n=1 Tax=Aquimarina callyspongiae TaxID=3098150 RepID=UPI002AB4FF18|nr:hypothetical protein [Aquimarina sp. 2201CG5-10]MDY8134687.1 hypothetical protein [Aquimarina sp. 2201CG5-10]
MSYSNTFNKTFSSADAKNLAAKVATDLKRIQRFYDKPSDSHISNYETEIIELLKDGYLDSVIYGFQKNGNWIEPTIKYTAEDLTSESGIDNDPGRITLGADVDGASFRSYLTYSSAWNSLSTTEQIEYENDLPFKRTVANEPGVDGYLSQDKTYTSGSKSLNRFSVKKY